MKKIYPTLGGWLIPALLLSPILHATAQNGASSQLSRLRSRQISFIVHAPVLLPELYKEQRYEAMQNFLANWKTADYPSRELIFAAEALLAIETGKFSAYWLPCDCLYYLAGYARELRVATRQDGKFRYYLKLTYPYSYDATENARSILLFIRSWARELVARPGLDNDELYICRTLAGDIPDPRTALRSDPATAPRIAALEKTLAVYNDAVFTSRRNGRRGTAAVTVGWWFPTGRLREVLGAHPAVGIQLGGRNKWNEYDVSWNIRFGYPTPQRYTFLRNDTLYATNYYDGGYAGFEYTRYLLHRTHFELGLTSGIGYDYFDVADGWGSHSDNPGQPLNVGSFDFNNGIRLKYFLRRKAYIGLTAKYHCIHYANSGGTNLDGNAFTLDLSFGSH
jgi:hypothetical protein